MRTWSRWQRRGSAPRGSGDIAVLPLLPVVRENENQEEPCRGPTDTHSCDHGERRSARGGARDHEGRLPGVTSVFALAAPGSSGFHPRQHSKGVASLATAAARRNRSRPIRAPRRADSSPRNATAIPSSAPQCPRERPLSRALRPPQCLCEKSPLRASSSAAPHSGQP